MMQLHNLYNHHIFRAFVSVPVFLGVFVRRRYEFPNEKIDEVATSSHDRQIKTLRCTFLATITKRKMVKAKA